MPNEPNILKLPKRLNAILKLPSQYITSLPEKTTQSASSVTTMKRRRRTYTHHWSLAPSHGPDRSRAWHWVPPAPCCPCPGQHSVR